MVSKVAGPPSNAATPNQQQHTEDPKIYHAEDTQGKHPISTFRELMYEFSVFTLSNFLIIGTPVQVIHSREGSIPPTQPNQSINAPTLEVCIVIVNVFTIKHINNILIKTLMYYF